MLKCILKRKMGILDNNNLTSFQKKVYTVVKRIPRGQTRTYAWAAKRVGKPGASRAVGQALKKNPFPLIVPCHRVTHASGAIDKYAFGDDLKRRLLELEREGYAGRDKSKT